MSRSRPALAPFAAVQGIAVGRTARWSFEIAQFCTRTLHAKTRSDLAELLLFRGISLRRSVSSSHTCPGACANCRTSSLDTDRGPGPGLACSERGCRAHVNYVQTLHLGCLRKVPHPG
jgi:hypothetical protein